MRGWRSWARRGASAWLIGAALIGANPEASYGESRSVGAPLSGAPVRAAIPVRAVVTAKARIGFEDQRPIVQANVAATVIIARSGEEQPPTPVRLVGNQPYARAERAKGRTVITIVPDLDSPVSASR